MQHLAYAYTVQVHPSTSVMKFSIVIFRNPPGRGTTDIPTEISTDESVPLNPKDILQLVVRLLATIIPKTGKTLPGAQEMYKTYLKRMVRFRPTVKTEKGLR